jgi:solute:Na+ symporter, SSS family
MNIILFLIFFVALGILYFVLGFRAARNVKTDTDYFIANRQLGIWQISSNLIATQLGGGMLLGTAASAYTIGLQGIFYTLGMALGFLLLACGVASRLQQFNVTTTAQLFQTQYGSPLLKKIASLLSIITLFGILIAQVVGFKSLMAGIGLGSWIAVIPFWLSVVAYTMVGGLRAITVNDMVQLTIIVTTFTTIFIVTVVQQPSALFSILTTQKQFFTVEAISLASVSGVILIPALFSLIEQDLAQRFFAARSKAIATISACNASIFLMLFALIPVYLGMQTKIRGLAVPQDANPLIIFLSNSMPDILLALALCSIVAAIISTADALMNGISANITQDFEIAKWGTLGDSLRISKITTCLVGVSALIASYFVSNDIIGILISSYELSVSCLLVPLLVCYFKKRVNKNAAFVSVLAGLFGFIVFRIYPQAIPKEILALGLSAIGYIVGNIKK